MNVFNREQERMAYERRAAQYKTVCTRQACVAAQARNALAHSRPMQPKGPMPSKVAEQLEAVAHTAACARQRARPVSAPSLSPSEVDRRKRLLDLAEVAAQRRCKAPTRDDYAINQWRKAQLKTRLAANRSATAEAMTHGLQRTARRGVRPWSGCRTLGHLHGTGLVHVR